MKNTLHIWIFLVSILVVSPVLGQQLTQFSQYLHNPIILNPATAGVNENLNVNLSYRNQWTGFNDAPKSYYISVDGVVTRPKKGTSLRSSRPGFTEVTKAKRAINHGIGGYMVSDTYGAFTNTAAYITYALHLDLSAKVKLALGLSGGMSGWKLSTDAIGVADPNDETYNYLMTKGLKKSFFDMNSGIWVFSEKFYVGYSSQQLLQNQIRDLAIPAEAKVNVHHFVTGGYKFLLNDDLSLTPSVMLKNMRPAPSALDINAKAEYKKQIWGGISYRLNDAVVIIVGYNIKDKIKVSYSYDATLSDISNHSSGTHEVVIGYKVFPDAQKSSVSFL